MSPQPHSGAQLRCPQCDEPVLRDSAFCGNCGASLPGSDTERDDQATTTFTPVSSEEGDGGYRVGSEPSPWASPDSDRYVPPQLYDGTVPSEYDPNATMIGSQSDYLAARDEPAGPQGVRGFVLGLIGLVLIAAVLALYLYDAWLSDSARETVESWLPWLE